LIKKKIKQSNDYIIVEHIYNVEQVKPQIKIEPFEVKIEDPTEVPLPITPPPSLPPGRYNWRPGPKDQGKMVSFNPVVHKQEFHSPPTRRKRASPASTRQPTLELTELSFLILFPDHLPHLHIQHIHRRTITL